MIKQTDRTLVVELVKSGVLAQPAAEQCFKELDISGESLRAYLLRQGLVTEDQLLDAMSSVFKIPTCRLRDLIVDKTVLDRIPVRFAWYYKFMPLKIQEKTLFLDCDAPLDVKFQD